MLNPDRLSDGASHGLRQSPQLAGLPLLDVGVALGAVRRRWLIIVLVVLTFLGLAVAYVQTSKALYTAQISLVINPREAMEFGSGAVNPTMIQIGMDPSSINSQVELIRSNSVAINVLKKLELRNDPEFLTPSNPVDGALKWIRHAIAPRDSAGPLSPEDVPPEVVETFLDRLDVERVNETYVLTVRFQSREPERAAAIANAIGQEFIASQQDAKRNVAEQTGEWLTAQLEKQRQDAIRAEREVQQFRATNDIIGAGADSIVNDQMVRETAGQLVAAEAATAQLQAKFQQLSVASKSPKPDAAVVDFLDDPEVMALRTKYSQTVLQAAQAESIWGPGNVKIAEAMKVSLREQMADALGRLMLTYNKRLSVAKANEESLRVKMGDLVEKMKKREAAQVDLGVLQRNSDTSATIYQTILERYKTVVQQQSFPVTEARIVDSASIPHAKSSPRMIISLALGGIAGLACGLGGALLLELRSQGIRLPHQAEEVTQAPMLGFLPNIPKRLPRERWRAASDLAGSRQFSSDIGVYRYVADRPFSLFAETLRSIKIAAASSTSEGPVKVIGWTSSQLGEGKSLSSCNYAQILAQSGNKVLLIDADLRTFGLSSELIDGPALGLIDVLIGTVDWEAAVLTDPVTGLNFLPGGGTGRVPNGGELLGSSESHDFFKSVSAVYDYVVVDLPPMWPLVDVRAASSFIDAFVVAVRWGETSKSTLDTALKGNAMVRERMLGTVLTRFNLNDLRRYLPDGAGSYSKQSMESYFG